MSWILAVVLSLAAPACQSEKDQTSLEVTAASTLRVRFDTMADHLLNGIAPTPGDEEVMEILADLPIDDEQRDAVQQFQYEMAALGINAADLDERIDEITTTTLPALQRLRTELDAFINARSTIDTAEAEIGSAEFGIALACIPVAIAACTGGILHCRQQASDINAACLVQTCTDGGRVNAACCANLLRIQGAACWNCGLSDPNPNAMGCCCQCDECWNDNPTECFEQYPSL